LAEIWQDLLGVDRVGIHDNFFELGGDSIITIQVTSRSKRAGYDIRPKDIFLYQSISGISGMLGSRQGVSQVLSEQGYLTGECGLLPIQQWFLEKGGEGQSHYNQSMLLGIDKAIEEQTLSVVLKELVKRHDVLRFGYRHGADGWHQSYGEKEYELDVLELEDVSEEALSSSIGSYAASCQSGLDIEQGDLLRMVLIKTPESSPQNRLLFVIHHLSVDGVSWRVLQDDMEFLLDGLSTGEVKSLGYKSSSYRDWYQGLERYGQSRRLLSQSGYWDRICKLYSALPVDKLCSEAVRLEDFGGYQIKLSREQTKLLLQEVPRVYHTEINDILLSALGLTLSKWSGRRSIQIGLEGHGREESIVKEIDLSRTVGWFTSLYPVSLDIDHGSMNDVIKGVKEQLRGIPDKGLGYGVLRYINKEASLNGVQPWDIVFNYLGQFDNVVNLSKWFGGASESTGSDASGGHIMTEKLTVNSQVSSGELQVHWGYSTKHYNRDTIQGLGDSYIKELQALISHCITAGDSGEKVTPSDYGLGAEISYQELDRFLQEEKKSKTDIMEF
jgi:non-ribosomal peptide synthase protein (TIGR01720 family)